MKSRVFENKIQNEIKTITIEEKSSIGAKMSIVLDSGKIIEIDEDYPIIHIALDVLIGKLSAHEGFDKFFDNINAPGMDVNRHPMAVLLRFTLKQSRQRQQLIDKETYSEIRSELSSEKKNSHYIFDDSSDSDDQPSLRPGF